MIPDRDPVPPRSEPQRDPLPLAIAGLLSALASLGGFGVQLVAPTAHCRRKPRGGLLYFGVQLVAPTAGWVSA